MQHRFAIVVLLALSIALVLGRTGSAQPAATPTTIHLATLAPRGSAPYRVLSAWGNSLRVRVDYATACLRGDGRGDLLQSHVQGDGSLEGVAHG